eukprot:4344157-Prymnesium_polylepis.2
MEHGRLYVTEVGQDGHSVRIAACAARSRLSHNRKRKMNIRSVIGRRSTLRVLESSLFQKQLTPRLVFIPQYLCIQLHTTRLLLVPQYLNC